MEGCSKKSDGIVAGLPNDPLIEILSRVPAKSVCRFKCVSKAWRDLIADPVNRKKLPQAMQGLFVEETEEGLFVEVAEVSEVNDTKLASISLSLIDLTVRSVPMEIDPSFSFLMERTGIKTFFFLDSCNGLILFGHCQVSSHESVGTYMVCNPTTKQWSAVPACGSCEVLSHTCLAFDPVVSSHFHLVQFQMPDVNEHVVSLHVYSSENGTWSQNQIDKQKEKGQLEGWHHQFTLEDLDYRWAFVNGFLHLIVWGLDRHHILVLDIQGKARNMITVPGMADGSQRQNITCCLSQSQGHLHCVTIEFAHKSKDKLSIWVLQNYDTQEWVLKNTVDLDSVDVFGDLNEFQVVDIHQDCNVVFFLQESCKLTAYDMDRKEVSVIATFKYRKHPSNFARYVPYFSESSDLTNKY